MGSWLFVWGHWNIPFKNKDGQRSPYPPSSVVTPFLMLFQSGSDCNLYSGPLLEVVPTHS